MKNWTVNLQQADKKAGTRIDINVKELLAYERWSCMLFCDA